MAAVDYDKLAAFYDCLVEAGDDIPFFLEEGRRATGPVLELMAGTGRISVPLIQDGIDLTCLDGSEAMLERLRGKLEGRGLRALLLCQDAARFDAGRRFGLIFIGFNSFEEILGDADRSALLESARRHLEPGGRFICTLHDPARRLETVGPGREQRWVFTCPEAGGEMELTLSTRFHPRDFIVEGLETIRRADTGRVILELPLRFRLCGQEEFRRLASGAGFRVEALHGGTSREPYTPGESPGMIWILQRPEGEAAPSRRSTARRQQP